MIDSPNEDVRQDETEKQSAEDFVSAEPLESTATAEIIDTGTENAEPLAIKPLQKPMKLQQFQETAMTVTKPVEEQDHENRTNTCHVENVPAISIIVNLLMKREQKLPFGNESFPLENIEENKESNTDRDRKAKRTSHGLKASIILPILLLLLRSLNRNSGYPRQLHCQWHPLQRLQRSKRQLSTMPKPKPKPVMAPPSTRTSV